LLSQKLKELSEADDLKRNVAFMAVERLSRSTTLTRKDAKEEKSLADLFGGKPNDDPVLELLRQGFAFTDSGAEESLAAPSAKLAVELVSAYLSKLN
jgi:hypothetical protein